MQSAVETSMYNSQLSVEQLWIASSEPVSKTETGSLGMCGLLNTHFFNRPLIGQPQPERHSVAPKLRREE